MLQDALRQVLPHIPGLLALSLVSMLSGFMRSACRFVTAGCNKVGLNAQRLLRLRQPDLHCAALAGARQNAAAPGPALVFMPSIPRSCLGSGALDAHRNSPSAKKVFLRGRGRCMEAAGNRRCR